MIRPLPTGADLTKRMQERCLRPNLQCGVWRTDAPRPSARSSWRRIAAWLSVGAKRG